MRVKVYAVNQATGAESLANECNLSECLDDAEEYYEAHESLRNAGRYWVGGGAAALFLLVRQH